MASATTARAGISVLELRLWPAILYLPAVLLGAAYVEADYFRAPYRYVLADAVAASTAIVIVAAAVALAGAVQMSVIVDVWGRLDVRRSTVAVYLRQLLPAIGVGVTAMATIYGIFVGSGVLQIERLWSIALVSLVSVVAWACFGALLGLWLSPIVAYPLSILLPLFALSFPVAWEPLWVRHLTGALFDCCGPAQVLDGAAVGGSLLAAAALIAGSVGLSALRLGDGGRPSLPVVAFAIAAIGLTVAAVSAVDDLGALPTSPRPTGEVACRDGFCVWEEAAPSLDANIDALQRTTRAWQALGLPIDGPIEVHPAGADDRLRLAVTSETEDQVLVSMTERFPAELARCDRSSSAASGGTTGYDPSADRLSWLLGVELGIPRDQLTYLLLDGQEVDRSDAAALWRQAVACSS